VTRQLTPAELNQRRHAATLHGGYSPIQIRSRARAHQRRFLRQIGLRASGLDAIALGYLDGWARSLARVDLIDAAEHPTEAREYYAALNAARLWLAKLEARLALLNLDRGEDDRDPLAALEAAGRRVIEDRATANGDAA
jgi:hypothetical protein